MNKERKNKSKERADKQQTSEEERFKISSVSTSLPDLPSKFCDKCVLSNSDASDAACPLCGLTFLEDDSGCVVMAVSLGLILNVLH